MKPILLLDVDGPLNVWRAKKVEPNSVRSWPLVDTTVRFNGEVGRTRFRWAPDIVKKLAQLPLEARWLSSWCVTCQPGPLKTNDHPNDCLAPLFGWPELPDATEPYSEYLIVRFGHGWKHRIVQEVANEGRPIVWADDEAREIAGLHSQKRRTTIPNLGVPNLIVSPDPNVGLTLGDLDHIAAWCDKL